MKYILFLVVFFIVSCNNEKTETKLNSVSYDSAYQAAVFTDVNRLSRITLAFPIIDSLFSSYAQLHHLPGVAYGIVVDGQLVHTGNYGYTDIAKQTPVTSSSLFRVASMSKSFTAMAILKLRDAGKLQLDDPAEKHIPELKNLVYPTADAPHITIRHLLSHGAGFPEDNPWGDRQLADTDKELMEFIGKQIIFSNPPGIAYEYSNLGFALLGKIVTNVSGLRYQDYIKQNIWQPLGMNTSEWEYGNVSPELLAHGYRWLNEKWNEEELLHDTPDGSWGAMGSMISSINEFSKYMALHLSAWPASNLADSSPVKRSSVREMHHPWRFTGMNMNYRNSSGESCPVSNAYTYGLGWMKDCENKVWISHSGGLPGFGSQWRILPDYGIGVVSFANRTYAPMGGINTRVIDTLIQIAGLQSRVLPPSRFLQQRQQELMKLLPDWSNAEKSGLFAENFFPDNPIDSLRKDAQQLFAKAGKIISVKEMKPQNQLRGSFLIEGELANLEVYFTLSPENPPLIQQYAIREAPRPPLPVKK